MITRHKSDSGEDKLELSNIRVHLPLSICRYLRVVPRDTAQHTSFCLEFSVRSGTLFQHYIRQIYVLDWER